MNKHIIYFWLLMHCLNNGTIEAFELNDVITIQQDSLIAVLDNLPKEYQISLEVYLKSFLIEDLWSNVIHLTIGGNAETYGDRIFGFFLLNNRVQFSASVKGITNYITFLSQTFKLNEWAKITINQFLMNGIYMYSIKVDETVVISLENTGAQTFKSVRVYTGSPWFGTQPGYIRNLNVSNSILMPFFTVKSVLQPRIYLTTMKTLPKEYEITFEAFFTSYPPNVWSNVIFFGAQDERVFLITVFNSVVYACASVNGDVGYYKAVKTYNLNEWITFSVKQIFYNGFYTHTVQIAGVTVDTLQNTAAKVFQNIDVYAFYKVGFIRKLIVINGCPCRLIMF